MPVLHEPIVNLEAIKLRAVSLSSLEFDVAIQVQNANPLDVTLRELTFTVLCRAVDQGQQVATGTTGRMNPARGSTLLHIPVKSQNAALIGAIATLVIHGGVQVTIQGTAIIDCLLFGWSIPFSKSMPVTMEQIADSLAGQKMEK